MSGKKYSHTGLDPVSQQQKEDPEINSGWLVFFIYEILFLNISKLTKYFTSVKMQSGCKLIYTFVMTTNLDMIKNSFLFGFSRFMGFSSYYRFFMPYGYCAYASHLTKNITTRTNRKTKWNHLDLTQNPI